MTDPVTKTASMNNFIATYDGYITPDECKKAIQLFDSNDKFNKTLNRLDFENTPVTWKQDQQYFAQPDNFECWHEELKSMIVNFDQALNHYTRTTGVLEAFGREKFFYTNLKIQKTLPTEGYHIWHVEYGADYECRKRALVFAIYLNDVEEGGETEFLHFSKRVKPKQGRIVIWPASFPYVHRGNPPLSGEKYLVTSWLLLA